MLIVDVWVSTLQRRKNVGRVLFIKLNLVTAPAKLDYEK